MIEPRPYFVAIVGGSGSGKSWLAEGLKREFHGKALLLSLDDFYRDRSDLSPKKRASLNFDDPRAIDWPLFQKVLQDLRHGRTARLPVYDFATHCRRSKRRTARARPVILVEGLWLLHSRDLRRRFDLSIFLDCCARTRRRRRLERDVRARGRTRKSVLEQFRTTVQPMHKRFVEPQSRWARTVLKEGFSRREIEKIANLIKSSLQRFSSTPAPKRGNTR